MGVTKVTLRKRLLPSGKITLYLDFYPPLRDPHSRKYVRHEYLGIYLVNKPRFQSDKDANKEKIAQAEAIRSERELAIIRGQYDFLDKTKLKMDFLAYFKTKLDTKDQKWIRVYDHFSNYCGGVCKMGDITVPFCEGFREYLLNAKQLKHPDKQLAQNSAAGYWSTFRGFLKIAYQEKLLQENVNDYLETEHIVDAFNEVLGRMRALDESRQEFVSNVSHELKTPMTSMKVLADSLLADPNTPPEMYREFLTDIDNEIDRENKIIAELLNLAKMDRRQVPMNISSVNINALLEIIMKRVRPLAQQRDIELTLISERDVTAEVDEVKMTMVFTNLIENAVKYNREHGTVKVTINSDARNFILTVEDTGIGIPEESQGRVFERFYRVDKSRSREVGGTGLGLSITKSAVLLHRGTIDLKSRVGEGSTFTVTIPLSYIPDTAAGH